MAENQETCKTQIIKYEPTLRAFLLNLFITENCLSLDLTTSPRGTFGAFLAFWSQGCSGIQKYSLSENMVAGKWSKQCWMMLTFLDTLKLIKAVTTVGYEISNIIYTKEQGYKGEDLINFYKKLTHQTIFRKKKTRKLI